MHYHHHGRPEFAGCRGRFMGGRFGQYGHPGFSAVPVNIRETDAQYEIHVAAPGRNKTDFQISVESRILTIAYQAEQAEKTGQDNWVRNEFRLRSFERRFELHDGIDADNITAQYNEGVLLVTLPKVADYQSPKHEVPVA